MYDYDTMNHAVAAILREQLGEAYRVAAIPLFYIRVYHNERSVFEITVRATILECRILPWVSPLPLSLHVDLADPNCFQQLCESINRGVV